MNRTHGPLFRWIPLVALGLLQAPALHADYDLTTGPGRTLGLWSRWQVQDNLYTLEVYLAHREATPQQPIRLIDLSLAWDPALLAAAGAPVPGQLFDGYADVFHACYPVPGGLTWTSTLLGPQPGVTPGAPVRVLSLDFHALDPAGGPATLTLADISVRGEANQPIPCGAPPQVQLLVDTEPPTGYVYGLTAQSPPGNPGVTWLPTVNQLLLPGDGSLHSLVIGESAPAPDNDSPLWLAPPPGPTFELAAGNGPHTVYSHLRDRYGNRTTLSATILLDDQPPAGVGDLTVRPRHQGVQLDWSLPGDPDLAVVEIWRAPWQDHGPSAYPEYDDLVPMGDWPADRAGALAQGFTQVYSGLGTSLLDPVIPRDVYRYLLITRDQAGLYSALGPGQRGRATNYFLGDFATPYNGTVHIADLVRLSNAYNTEHGDPYYYNQADIGPSDTNGPLGIPLTDNRVDFEDLMLFAMNYGISGPPLSDGHPSGLDIAATANAARLYWKQEAVGWSLRLEGGPLLGLRLVIRDPDPALRITAEPWTLLESPVPGGLELALVALDGGGLAGRLLTVSGERQPTVAGLTLRDLANRPLEPVLDTAPETLPAGFVLYPASPNPFNPSTWIRFSLDRPGPVRLDLYDIQGRRVSTLLEADLPAGEHGLSLEAGSLASGSYLLDLSRAGVHHTRRVSLIR